MSAGSDLCDTALRGVRSEEAGPVLLRTRTLHMIGHMGDLPSVRPAAVRRGAMGRAAHPCRAALTSCRTCAVATGSFRRRPTSSAAGLLVQPAVLDRVPSPAPRKRAGVRRRRARCGGAARALRGPARRNRTHLSADTCDVGFGGADRSIVTRRENSCHAEYRLTIGVRRTRRALAITIGRAAHGCSRRVDTRHSAQTAPLPVTGHVYDPSGAVPQVAYLREAS